MSVETRLYSMLCCPKLDQRDPLSSSAPRSGCRGEGRKMSVRSARMSLVGRRSVRQSETSLVKFPGDLCPSIPGLFFVKDEAFYFHARTRHQTSMKLSSREACLRLEERFARFSPALPDACTKKQAMDQLLAAKICEHLQSRKDPVPRGLWL